MDKNKDSIEQVIRDELELEAESIDEEIKHANMEPMSLEVKDRIKGRLFEQIDAYEKEKVYSHLSDEDKKALELGREMLKKQETEEIVVHRRRNPKIHLVLAAVLVLVLAMGVTSIGGAKRVIQMIRIAICDREIVRIETAEDNYIDTDEREEETYQKLRKIFGVDVVKPVSWPEGTKFVEAEIDEDLQTAYLKYEYEGEIISYFISSLYTDSSWGMDVEDRIINRYSVNHEKKGKIEIKEYESDQSKIKSYSVNFVYDELEYLLTGVMKKSEFEILIKNLIFF